MKEKEEREREMEQPESMLTILGYRNPILKKTSSKINFVDDEMKKLIEDMSYTMLAKKGIGLAAAQVGLNKRFFVFVSDFEAFDSGEEIEINVAINPQILSREGEIIEYEGCLSYPDHVAQVKRAIKTKTRYYDINMNKIEEEYTGLAARVFQHELDHLDGILFIDRMEADSLKHVDELKKDEEDEEQVTEPI
ncbi:peptide deformylase [bacterium]|nr:peptide deformylase [bacterium]